jgi:hypothetical protein
LFKSGKIYFLKLVMDKTTLLKIVEGKMQTCDQCGATRLLSVSAKCSDMCSVVDMNDGREEHGYVPRGVGIGGGDYVELTYCLQCGKIQGEFPNTNDPFED